MAADEADTPTYQDAAGRFHLKIDYDTDFDAWAQAQAQALRAKDWAALDLEHLAEEVEDLRKTERKAVWSQLRQLTSHLLKWAYQPTRRGESWQTTILDARRLVADGLEENGTLTPSSPPCLHGPIPAPVARRPKIRACPWRCSPRPAGGR